MCGIVGLWSRDKTPEHANHMLEALRTTSSLDHRGPDEQNYSVMTGLVLRFSHLKIMDTREVNRQPFESKSWRIWMNGCVYNTAELRSLYGIPEPRSTSDTEVVAELVERLSLPGAVVKLNGMFVIVAQHIQTGRVWIARDRYGIKPMFWCETPDGFAFASEIAPLLKFNPMGVNRDAVGQWLGFQTILGQETLFQGIRSVKPATLWSLDTGHVERFWGWDFNPDPDMDYEDAVQGTREKLQSAVERQSCAERPISMWLSGGVDSSAIAAMTPETIVPLCADFDEDEFSESGWAELVRSHVGKTNDLVRWRLKAGDMWRNLYDTIKSLGTLRAGPSWSNRAMYEITRDFGPVCLQGTGGDEIFGGYTWRYDTARDYFDIVYRSRVNLCSFAFDARACIPNAMPLQDRYTWDAEHFLTGVLHAGDHLSMAQGIEDRVPFLDNDLVDFAVQIPHEFKFNKKVLKESLRDLLPVSILSRPKRGFTSPESLWYYESFSRARIMLLIKTTEELREFVDTSVVDSLFETRNTAALWSIVALAIWLRINLRGESREDFITLVA
jgi:asparagine synthase (glutamine-hydrolysing)